MIFLRLWCWLNGFSVRRGGPKAGGFQIYGGRTHLDYPQGIWAKTPNKVIRLTKYWVNDTNWIF